MRVYTVLVHQFPVHIRILWRWLVSLLAVSAYGAVQCTSPKADYTLTGFRYWQPVPADSYRKLPVPVHAFTLDR